ncbi:MAG: Permease of the drug/metabolite transporter (DMT) superfamily [Chloroflexi bacterium]|nr:MAG: Permease of the drug/metabolite transporter (DMT) superfamily [Chloroflexota bacterium]
MSYLDGVSLAIISTIGFGATAVLAQSGMQYVKPTSITIISLVVGSILVFIVAFIVELDQVNSISIVALLFILLNAVLSYPIGRLFNFISVKYAGASRASSVIGIAPLITTGLAVWLTGEKLTIIILTGSLLILLGIFLILTDMSSVKTDNKLDANN